MNNVTIDEIRNFYTRWSKGEITAAEIRPMWERITAGETALKAEFAALSKDKLSRYVGYHAQRGTKAQMVENAFDNMQQRFVAGSSLMYQPEKQSMAQAIEAQLGKWTDELIQQQAAERNAEDAAKQKAISNPETLDEFSQFVRYHGRRKLTPEQVQHANELARGRRSEELVKYLDEIGRSKLTPEQLTRYEALLAEHTKGQRREQQIQRKTAEEGQLPEGVTMAVQQTTHTVKGHALWVVQLSERVDREVFESLNVRAKKIGGYYSSFARNGAVPGFQFDNADKAQRFMSMERIDGEIRVQEIQAVRQERAEERLSAVGDRLQERGQEALNRDRKENTSRRAAMAASAEADARSTIQLGKTAENLGAAVGAGATKFLDRLYNAEQVAMLGRLLKSAQYARLSQLQSAGKLSDYQAEKERHEPLAIADAACASYPWPVVHTSMLRDLVSHGAGINGAKLLAGRVRKIGAASGGAEMVTLLSEYDRDTVRDLARRCLSRGSRTADWILMRFEDCDRLQRMDIRTEPELRTALREYVEYRAETLKPDPIKAIRRSLVGSNIPGFFPTPPGLASEVVRQARIEPGMLVLEPNGGAGDLADKVRELAPAAEIHVAEVNAQLISVLEHKGYQVVHRGDFLQFNPGAVYDRIVMNPPFEDGQAIEHVQHAYKLLKPGGILAAVMDEGAFFHSTRKAVSFRQWLGECGGVNERNPAGSFAGDDAFRQTGVATRTVVIERRCERQAVEIALEDSGSSEAQSGTAEGRVSVAV